MNALLGHDRFSLSTVAGRLVARPNNLSSLGINSIIHAGWEVGSSNSPAILMSGTGREIGLHTTRMQTVFDHHAFPLWVAVVALVLLLMLWVMRVQSRTRRLESYIDSVLQGVSGESTAQALVEYLRTVRSTAAALDHMRREHDQVVALMPGVVRHVGLIRFSPFHDTGGDQSFTLALLDGKRDGIVLTGLHSRSDSRLYAKPIESGSSTYALIPEEREAIQRAVSGMPATAEVR